MNKPLWMLEVQRAKADVKPVANLSVRWVAFVLGNVHEVSSESVVIDTIAHFRREEEEPGTSCICSRTMPNS